MPSMKLPTKKGTEIVTVNIRNLAGMLTVLYSHGNTIDLGQMYELFIELSHHLRLSDENEVAISLTSPAHNQSNLICVMLCADHGPCVSGAHNSIVTTRAEKDLVSYLVSGMMLQLVRFGKRNKGLLFLLSKEDLLLIRLDTHLFYV